MVKTQVDTTATLSSLAPL